MRPWIPLTVDFTQDGAAVTGSMRSTFNVPPNYEWTVQTGTVSIDGVLRVTSDETAFRAPDGTAEIRARVTDWESRAETAGVMTGTVVIQYSSDALSGDAEVEACFEADNIIRECSGWRRQGGRAVWLRHAPVAPASPRYREVIRGTDVAVPQPWRRDSSRARSLRSCVTCSGVSGTQHVFPPAVPLYARRGRSSSSRPKLPPLTLRDAAGLCIHRAVSS